MLCLSELKGHKLKYPERCTVHIYTKKYESSLPHTTVPCVFTISHLLVHICMNTLAAGGEVGGEIVKTPGTVGCGRDDPDLMCIYVHRTPLSIDLFPFLNATRD
jgi:hypothetical protein